MLEPTEKQLKACEGMNWEYIGDGLFIKGDLVGWFTENGFMKVNEEEFI